MAYRRKSSSRSRSSYRPKTAGKRKTYKRAKPREQIVKIQLIHTSAAPTPVPVIGGEGMIPKSKAKTSKL